MSGYETRMNRTVIGEVLATRVFPLTDVFTKQPLMSNGSIMFPDIRSPVVDFLLVSTPDSFEVNNVVISFLAHVANPKHYRAHFEAKGQ
jgi:hypothetical protein